MSFIRRSIECAGRGPGAQAPRMKTLTFSQSGTAMRSAKAASMVRIGALLEALSPMFLFPRDVDKAVMILRN